MKKLPIGIQTFKTIVEENYIYVDKTELIYQLVKGKKGRYFFLSRPRRFGKSLLISTLKELFSGNRKLFKSLWIDKSDYNWAKYPIIFLDFSSIAHRTAQELDVNLIWELERIAKSYNIDISTAPSIEAKFKQLVSELYERDHKKVIILIDEYDKPLLDHIHDIKNATEQQEVLRSFYSAVKAADAYIRFIFLTGITKFSKTSVFSGLNNLTDLTLSLKMNSLLGYTQEEIETYFDPYLNALHKKQKNSLYDVRGNMRIWYNGYRFSKRTVKVYNPYSVLSYLNSGELKNYWFETGTPSFLVKLITTKEYRVESIENSELNTIDLESLELDNIPIILILFQTGYLTIKSFNPKTQNYRLGYPNEETKLSFLNYFISRLTTVPVSSIRNTIVKLTQALEQNSLDLFFEALKVFFAGMPYTMQLPQEKYYQSIFYVITTLIGAYVESEVTTNEGRIDTTITTAKHIYILEYKINQSAEVALKQIEDNRYYQKYLHSNKQIVLIGVEFDTKMRNIKNWITKII